jgi:hypothetical protein
VDRRWARCVPLEGDLQGSGAQGDDGDRQQHVLQPVVGQDRSGSPQAFTEHDHDSPQANEAQQSGQAQWSKHWDRHHRQVEQVVADKVPAIDRQPKLGSVLDPKGRPDEIIERIEGQGDCPWP